jgi:hypothetical protein
MHGVVEEACMKVGVPFSEENAPSMNAEMPRSGVETPCVEMKAPSSCSGSAYLG